MNFDPSLGRERNDCGENPIGECIPNAWKYLDAFGETTGIDEPDFVTQEPELKSRSISLNAYVTLDRLSRLQTFPITVFQESESEKKMFHRFGEIGSKILITQSDPGELNLCYHHQKTGQLFIAPLFDIQMSPEDFDRFHQGTDLLLPTFKNFTYHYFLQKLTGWAYMLLN